MGRPSSGDVVCITYSSTLVWARGSPVHRHSCLGWYDPPPLNTTPGRKFQRLLRLHQESAPEASSTHMLGRNTGRPSLTTPRGRRIWISAMPFARLVNNENHSIPHRPGTFVQAVVSVASESSSASGSELAVRFTSGRRVRHRLSCVHPCPGSGW